MNQQTTITGIPTTWVGPLRVSGEALAPNGTHTEVAVPLATYETPLWPSVGRGASISREIEGGIRTVIVDERMTRSVLFVAESAIGAEAAARAIRHRTPELESVVEAGSNHCRLIEIHPEIVGNLLFVRFAFRTNDASGHNMVTQASDSLMERILSWHLGLDYGSVSGNYCSDKKATAVNGILGRGRNVVAEILLPHEVVERRLRTTAEKMTEIVIRKDLVGSTIAGALRSANAHYANMLLAF